MGTKMCDSHDAYIRNESHAPLSEYDIPETCGSTDMEASLTDTYSKYYDRRLNEALKRWDTLSRNVEMLQQQLSIESKFLEAAWEDVVYYQDMTEADDS